MDAERFGRALGMGVRETAKALLKAADAAAAPDPRPAVGTPQPRPRTGPAGSVRQVPSVAAVRRGGKQLGRSVWAPAARAGGVLWFEVTGFFFGLFALTAGVEVWKRRYDFAQGGSPRQKACFALAMLVTFTWFTVSSFLKARRRARRA